MSEPDSRRPPGVSGAPASGKPLPGEQPYLNPASGDTDDWAMHPDCGPPPGWLADSTYVPDGSDGQPASDAPQASPPRRRRSRRQARGHLAAGAAVLALTALAVNTLLSFPGHGAIPAPPAGNAAPWANPGGLSVNVPNRHGLMPAQAGQPPALSTVKARQIVSVYWRISNQASEQRSGSLLNAIEAGTSYTMDTGTYKLSRATGSASTGYVPLTPIRTAYYIPRLAASTYPRWFAAQVTYARLRGTHQGVGRAYLLFTQALPGGTWKDVLKPDVIPRTGPGPGIAADAQGYAIAVSPTGNATGLEVAPRSIGPLTAAALNTSSTSVIRVPGNLADLHDQTFWRSRLPAGSTGTDTHRAGPGRVFGLRTRDGGALLLYAVTAELILAPPQGQVFRLDIPGYYKPSQYMTSAGIKYVEQFAAYDPPCSLSSPSIDADISSIVARN
jgi:hypothetical protein